MRRCLMMREVIFQSLTRRSKLSSLRPVSVAIPARRRRTARRLRWLKVVQCRQVPLPELRESWVSHLVGEGLDLARLVLELVSRRLARRGREGRDLERKARLEFPVDLHRRVSATSGGEGDGRTQFCSRARISSTVWRKRGPPSIVCIPASVLLRRSWIHVSCSRDQRLFAGTRREGRGTLMEERT